MRHTIGKYIGVALLLAGAPALAAIPEFWETRTYEEFRRGDLDGLSVSGAGALVLAPSLNLVFDTGEPLVFSAATDAVGNVYLGAGHDGRVYRVGAGGGEMLVDLPELDVLALAVDANDVLYAATSPNGKVYRVSADGDAEVFFDPGTRYIWAMTFDRDGGLLVATGDDGILYRVSPEGVGEVLYDSEETHLVTVATGADGEVIAGGDPKGYIYRISPDGRAFVLHDSGMREVRSVAASEEGGLYAALVSEGAQPPPAAPSESGAESTTGGSVTVTVGASVEAAAQNAVVQADAPTSGGPPPGGGSGRTPSSGGTRSAIVEIRSDGAVTTLWESTTEMVFALLPRSDGLLFSTGNPGRVYQLNPAEQRPPMLVTESSEEQITRLLASGNRLFAASSNAGKLFELTDRPAASGEYISAVRDTGAISSWGRMVWRGQGVELATRSGNTSSPDATWSEWAAVDAEGRIASPNARFLQWRAVLGDSGDGASLASVTVPYLQQNFRPEIRTLDVLQPGVALEPQPVTNPSPTARPDGGALSGRILPAAPRLPPRTAIRPGAQALRWSADDANGDVLEYSILYRAENEDQWKALVDRTAETFHTIEPNTLPDGTYVFRVIASDIGSNPPDRALTGERETRPFSIDSTPPAVVMSEGIVADDRARVRVEAEDGTSTLKQAEISVDAGPWRPVFPVDGILDSLRESFEFDSPELSAGEHVIAFRVYDQNENVGIGKTVVRIP